MESINIYAIYDKKGKRYDTPQFIPNDLFAKRWFYKIVADGQGQLQYFADDFELHHVGEFNVITGKIVAKKNIVIEGIQIGKEIQKNEKRNAA